MFIEFVTISAVLSTPLPYTSSTWFDAVDGYATNTCELAICHAETGPVCGLVDGAAGAVEIVSFALSTINMHSPCFNVAPWRWGVEPYCGEPGVVDTAVFSSDST